MKNLILSATSIIALSGGLANAEMAAPAPSQHAPVTTTAPSASASGKMKGEHHAKKHHAKEHHAKKHHAKKHGGKKHHAKHPEHCHPKHHGHHHHRHHAHHAHHVAADVEYVAFPAAQGCNVEYYQGATTCPYVCHGGYFWYPHAQATIIPGYTPANWNGNYWYASRMHPHAIYAEGQGVSFVIPTNMARHHDPMRPLYQAAPTVQAR